MDLGKNRNYKAGQSQDSINDAYDAVKQLIFRRVLNPGQKLLYKDLCESVGLSKTPILNALNRLVYEGFVIHEMNKGYRITPIDEKTISHLYEIRLELECLNVRNAVKTFTKSKMERLKKKHEELSAHRPEFTDSKKLFFDMEFHLEIARMGENKYSENYLKTIIEQIHFLYRLERGVDKRKDEIDHEHRSMVEKIAAQDSVAAEQCMRKHIQELHKLMLDYLEELDQKGEALWF